MKSEIFLKIICTCFFLQIDTPCYHANLVQTVLLINGMHLLQSDMQNFSVTCGKKDKVL